MGTWGEVGAEIIHTQTPQGAMDFDGVRRGYLKRLAEYTERNTIVYEATFNPPQGAGPPDLLNASDQAKKVADFLGRYDRFRSHARRIDRNSLREQGVKVIDLEDDQKLQDLVLSVHHAISHLMDKTGTTKIVENHIGKAWMRQVGVIQVPVPQPQLMEPQPNRQERRASASQKRKGKPS